MQRQLILLTLRELKGHVTAQQVHVRLAKEHPQISLATVYRNLNLLSQSGEARKIPMPDKGDRYDFRTDRHYHLYCTVCGRFEDAPALSLESVLQEACEKSGYMLQGYDLVFRGSCPHCAGESPKI